MGELANLGYPDARFAQQKVKVYAGRFETDAANNPPATSIKGQGFTVVHSATGQYTVTLDQAVAEILHVGPQLWGATSGTDAVNRVVLTPSPGSNRNKASFILETHSAAGTEADLDGPIVSFIAVCHMRAA